MNEATIRAAFEEWWRDSYGKPPGVHAVMTHVAFAAHLLTLLELMGNSKPTPNPSQIGSSLVERVATAMQPGTFDWSAYEGEARAAIHEVAAWMIDRKRDDDWLAPFEELADLLLEEAQR